MRPRLYSPKSRLSGRLYNRPGYDVAVATNPLAALGATWWYDAVDLTAVGQQSVTDRIGGVNTLRMGSTTGSDTNDPTVVLGPPNYWSFDGSDDYNQHSAANKPSGSTHTLLVVYKTTSASGFGVIWSGETSYDNSLMLIHSHPNVAVRYGGSTSATVAPGAGTLNDDTWRAVGAVVTGGTHKAYERVAGFGTAQASGGVAWSNPRWGTRGWTVTNQFFGHIRSVAYFPVALSLSDMNTAADYLLAGGYT